MKITIDASVIESANSGTIELSVDGVNAG
jgi:hypothetical protein